jgi:hypothetical protein
VGPAPEIDTFEAEGCRWLATAEEPFNFYRDTAVGKCKPRLEVIEKLVALTGVEWVSAQFSWAHFVLSRCSSVLLVQLQIVGSTHDLPAWQRGGSAPTGLGPQRTILNGRTRLSQGCRHVPRSCRQFTRNSNRQEAR